MKNIFIQFNLQSYQICLYLHIVYINNNMVIHLLFFGTTETLKGKTNRMHSWVLKLQIVKQEKKSMKHLLQQEKKNGS